MKINSKIYLYMYMKSENSGYFKSFKLILSLKSSVWRVFSKFSSDIVELDWSSVNSPITFSAIIDASSSLIFPTYKSNILFLKI